MICDYRDTCKIYLATKCLNGGIETNAPLSIEEQLECKMIDIEKSANSSGVYIANATAEILKSAMIIDSISNNQYLVIHRKNGGLFSCLKK